MLQFLFYFVSNFAYFVLGIVNINIHKFIHLYNKSTDFGGVLHVYSNETKRRVHNVMFPR